MFRALAPLLPVVPLGGRPSRLVRARVKVTVRVRGRGRGRGRARIS